MKYLELPYLDIPHFDISKYFTDKDNNVFPVNVICSANQERKKEIKKAARQSPQNKILVYINNHLDRYKYIEDSYHIEFDD